MTRSSHRAIGAMSELGRTALGYFHRLALRINDHKISYEMSPTNPWLPKNQLKALIAMSAIYSLSHKYTGGRNVSYEARLWNTNVSRRKPRRAQDRTDIKHMAGEAARGGQYFYPHVNNGEIISIIDRYRWKVYVCSRMKFGEKGLRYGCQELNISCRVDQSSHQRMTRMPSVKVGRWAALSTFVP